MTSRSSTRFVAALAVAALVLPALAFAGDHRPPGQYGAPSQGQQPQHQPSGKPGGQQQSRNAPHERPEFRYDESRYARDYYRHHKWEAPRPRSRVYVGHKLSRKYRHPLPQELRGRFHPRPGYDYYMVGDDIVLVAIAPASSSTSL